MYRKLPYYKIFITIHRTQCVFSIYYSTSTNSTNIAQYKYKQHKYSTILVQHEHMVIDFGKPDSPSSDQRDSLKNDPLKRAIHGQTWFAENGTPNVVRKTQFAIFHPCTGNGYVTNHPPLGWKRLFGLSMKVTFIIALSVLLEQCLCSTVADQLEQSLFFQSSKCSTRTVLTS